MGRGLELVWGRNGVDWGAVGAALGGSRSGGGWCCCGGGPDPLVPPPGLLTMSRVVPLSHCAATVVLLLAGVACLRGEACGIWGGGHGRGVAPGAPSSSVSPLAP